MQAHLTADEFAYLLTLVGASRIIGADNSRLFASDPVEHQQRMDAGRAQLQSAGWLIAEGGGWAINDWFVLIAATVASPEIVLSVTSYGADGSQSTVSYYTSNEVTVEQFWSQEHYVLRLFEVDLTLSNHLAAILMLPERDDKVPPTQLSFVADEFVAARAAASDDESADLRSLIETLSPAQPIPELVDALTSMRRDVVIEGAALGGANTLLAFDEIALLRDETTRLWLCFNEDDQIVFTSADRDSVASQIAILFTTLRRAINMG